ncbi:hypothetical protein ACFE04_031340 [Oxalis oulophora]
MASLLQLLAEEGFERKKPIKVKKPITDESVVALPIFICHDRRRRRSLEESSSSSTVRRNPSAGYSLRNVDLETEKANRNSLSTYSMSVRKDEPAIDEIAIRAVIGILSGYIGKYTKDESFRELIREKVSSCLVKKTDYSESENGVFSNLLLGILSIEKLVLGKSTKQDLTVNALKNSIQLLSIVASLNNKKSRDGLTCGVPNSHLSACAQLYLSIVYKLEKNDRVSATHLLQVFCDSPFLARTHLLPDLWEHFFLPHLLHLKVWYHKELECLSNSEHGDKEDRMKYACKVYNEQMDNGTVQFVLYYKQWLKVATNGNIPSEPDVPLPSKPSYQSSRRRSSDTYSSNSPSINKNLYRAVFGTSSERRSLDLVRRASMDTSVWVEQEQDEDNYNNFNYVHDKARNRRTSSSQISRNSKNESWPVTQKAGFWPFLNCQSVPTESVLSCNHTISNNLIKMEENVNSNQGIRNNSIISDKGASNDFTRAIGTICTSDIVSDCELAMRVIAKTWLDSNNNPDIETSISEPSVIEAIIDILFASRDDEILELVISILAEFVSKSDVTRQIVLNSSPQLKVFIRLLKTSGLFLKAAVLLYLLEPKAKQMISTEWMPLVLRVLEFGDQWQTLFTVQCIPREAAFYFLNQLLQGFDDNKNSENASELVCLGGLTLLLKCLECGDIGERNNAAHMICCCIRADGSCRNYLAENVNKCAILELIVVNREEEKFHGSALVLLAELLCLDRRTRILNMLNELRNGWKGFKTTHILLFYLRRAQPEERPIAASILLQLDILGDPSKSSVCKEEAIDALVESLDCEMNNERVQEESAKALFMLGSRFVCTGEPMDEHWILQQSGLQIQQISEDLFEGNKIVPYESRNEGERDAIETWHRKAAAVLLNSCEERFLAALSNAITNGIPYLARASLFTVAWIIKSLHARDIDDSQPLACSIIVEELSLVPSQSHHHCLSPFSTTADTTPLSQPLLTSTTAATHNPRLSTPLLRATSFHRNHSTTDPHIHRYIPTEAQLPPPLSIHN